MPLIEVVRPNGTSYITADTVGSDAERKYFSVMTELWGKLFFTSKEYYERWCSEGRKQNEVNGCFTNTKYYFDDSFENDDMMIIEAYNVDIQE